MRSRSPRTRTGSRRTIPHDLTREQRDRLRELLEDPDTWVLRHAWDDHVLDGRPGTIIDPAVLSRDHLAAAVAWLRQQRHPMYRVLEGGKRAPDGWLEAQPLYRRLEELLGR